MTPPRIGGNPLLLLPAVFLAGAAGAGLVLWWKGREAPRSVAAPPALAELLPPAPSAPAAIPAAAPAAQSAEGDGVLARTLPAVVVVETPAGRGSGFFVDRERLLTNAHVLGGAAYATVRTHDGEKLEGWLERKDADCDLAVLKVQGRREDAALELGSAEKLHIGQELLAVGTPLGLLQNTVTRGILGGLRRSGSALLLQTDAALNPGNSGGPLLDRGGRVVGISTAGFRGHPGLNFAVAADHARALLEGRPTALPAGFLPASGEALSDLRPPGPSEADRAREAGTRQYEARMVRLAAATARMEASFVAWLPSVYSGRHEGVPGRTYQLLTDPSAFPGAWMHGAQARLADWRKLALALRAEFQAAEEEARRADLYPGSRREVRARLGLDDGWWER